MSRRRYIGGSDAATVLGISPFLTPLDLYQRIIGIGEQETEPTPAMVWGTRLEPAVLAAYEHQEGERITERQVEASSDRYGFIVGHIDGVTSNGVLVEAKTARSAEGWGEPGTDEIPMHYLAQCAHYLALTNAPRCDVPVLIAGSDFRVYRVARDATVCANLIAREVEFWRKHVEAGVPPPPVNSQEANRRWREVTGKVIAVTGELLGLLNDLASARAEQKKLDAVTEKIELAIKVSLGDASAIVDESGNPLATWKTQTSSRLDQKLLAATYPEVASACRKESTTRVLRLTSTLTKRD